eukprot:TRINITY_DN108592_c0_g1_i1.p1 TRINITY_DN108592_c0_g1~~TRINITY_DN108592_c0_g1_i1.p1  ORF type:complete len:271 (+),score=47.75 TRINITY_DN108592_c0_g1_i1:74-886(+)
MPQLVLTAGAGCVAGIGVILGAFSRAYQAPVHHILIDVFAKLFSTSPQPASVATVAAPQDKPWMPKEHWLARHEIYMQPDRNKCQIVFLGDSITEGWLGAGVSVWKAKYAEPYNAFNLGIGGDEVQHVVWRVQHGALSGLAPKVLVLMIGTNNIGNVGHNASEVADGIGMLLQELQARLPQTKILLLGVLPRDAQPGTRFRKEISLLNSIIQKHHDGTDIFFLDTGAQFLNKDESISKNIMPDFLHLSTDAYGIWAESLDATLKVMMESS